MDRALVFVGEKPQTVDVLGTGKFGMVGQGYAARSILGTNMVIEGLACTPTTPTADLNIHVGVGSIYATAAADVTAYGDLGTDASIIVKQGLLAAPLTFAITPPGTGGQSQVFLVEATLAGADGASKVVQYFSGFPLAPFNGPANSGTPQNTNRTVLCTVQIKAGTAATTGTQTTPAADSGFVPLWAVTVANGATQITAANILMVPAAPYFPTLPQIPPDVQTSSWTYAIDTGAVNALATTVSGNVGVWPPVTLIAGLLVYIKVGHTNTAATTFNLNGLGAVAVHRATGVALSAGDLTIGEIVALVYDGSAWQVLNYIGPLITTQVNNFSSYSIAYGTDHGAPNAIVASLSQTVTLAAGLVILIKVAYANTSATTCNANNLGVIAVKENGKDLNPFGVVPGELIVLMYDGSVFQKMPRRWPYFFFDASAPPAPYRMAVGDHIVQTFTNVIAILLNIATVNGVYSIRLIVTKSNTQNCDVWFQPNDILLPARQGSFSEWVITNNDMGSSGPVWVQPTPLAATDNDGFLDMFSQPSSSDTVNDRAPFILEIVCLTTSGIMRFFGGITGGPSIGFATWSGGAWTSLGTIQIPIRTNTDSSPSGWANLTGVVSVTRLA